MMTELSLTSFYLQTDESSAKETIEWEMFKLGNITTKLIQLPQGNIYQLENSLAGSEIFFVSGEALFHGNLTPPNTYIQLPCHGEVKITAQTDCLIYISLNELSANEYSMFALPAESVPWVLSKSSDIQGKGLYEKNGLSIQLLKFPPGSFYPMHVHGGVEEYLIIEGDIMDENGEFPAISWFRYIAGTSHEPRSKDGSLVFARYLTR